MRLLKFILFYTTAYPILILLGKRASVSSAWVIGGHAGREYSDNAAALHKYIVNHTQQPVIWITNNHEIYHHLSRKKISVFIRDSFRARIAIIKAPVIIRSHGYRDIDLFLGKYIKLNGLEIHVNHSMKYIKAGEMYSPKVEKMGKKEYLKHQKKFSKFDYALASSNLEQRNFKLSLPHLADKIILGGGAHLDELTQDKENKNTDDAILYFPTWRDKHLNANITTSSVLQQLTSNIQLRKWLDRNSYKFYICMHINSKDKIDSESWPTQFILLQPNELTDHLLNCKIFVSDYSGAILDALYLDLPVVFFPFDYDEYTKLRNLYIDYENFAFGPVVKTVDELINTITQQQWLRNKKYFEKRKETFGKIFPEGYGGYSKRSYETIRQLVAQTTTSKHQA